jgi:hypothetical protein
MFCKCSWIWNQPKQNFWSESVKDQHLISVDELRAAGALDVPEGWRSSLGVERSVYLLPGFGDEEPEAAEQKAAQQEPEGDLQESHK